MTRRLDPLLRLVIAAMAPAMISACGGNAPAYVIPAKLPPCPRAIGVVYAPGSAQSAPGGSATAGAATGDETAGVIAAAAAATPPAASVARQPYVAGPRPPRAVAPVASCGDKKNPCPLQLWMREKMATALAAKDAPALAAALDRMASFSPSPGPEWKTISVTAAAAARRGDVAEARKSCQGCHAAFKVEYKQKLRTRPVVPW